MIKKHVEHIYLQTLFLRNIKVLWRIDGDDMPN